MSPYAQDNSFQAPVTLADEYITPLCSVTLLHDVVPSPTRTASIAQRAPDKEGGTGAGIRCDTGVVRDETWAAGVDGFEGAAGCPVAVKVPCGQGSKSVAALLRVAAFWDSAGFPDVVLFPAVTCLTGAAGALHASSISFAASENERARRAAGASR